MSFFFVVDKSFGESHSFVDGAIKGIALKISDRSRLYYARGIGFSDDPCVVQSRFTRAGLSKLFYSTSALFYYFYHYGFLSTQSVFVRNEFFVLFLFSLFKRLGLIKGRLVFQSSFPHELYGGRVKSFLARLLLKLSLPITDEVLVVSLRSAERIQSYTSRRCLTCTVVPLCSDFPLQPKKDLRNGKICFVYAGTFSSIRQLDLILSAFQVFQDECPDLSWELRLLGGSRKEFIENYPLSLDVVKFLERQERLFFEGKVERDRIPEMLARYDVGLNLIPPKKIYLESSSTKLGEYLSSSLPVLSNLEIDYHVMIHAYSDVGWLTYFDVDSIVSSLKRIVNEDESEYLKKSASCGPLVSKYLRYDNFPIFSADSDV